VDSVFPVADAQDRLTAERIRHDFDLSLRTTQRAT
jgi:hypothetical protein